MRHLFQCAVDVRSARRDKFQDKMLALSGGTRMGVSDFIDAVMRGAGVWR
jgi:hypothetical protein